MRFSFGMGYLSIDQLHREVYVIRDYDARAIERVVGRATANALCEHAIPLLQSRIIVLRLHTLRDPQQNKLEHLLYARIGFDGVGQALAVIPEFDHVPVRRRACNVIRYLNTRCRYSWTGVVNLERAYVGDYHGELWRLWMLGLSVIKEAREKSRFASAEANATYSQWLPWRPSWCRANHKLHT